MSPTKSPPPWEVLVLVANHLDPKTLAVAACVSKSWSISMSSDNLWKPICDATYPSLSILHSTDPAVPFRRLFSIALAASKLRNRTPSKPHLSLNSLTFIVDVRTPDYPIATLAKPGSELKHHPSGMFQFEMDNGAQDQCRPIAEITGRVRVTWNVVARDWGAVFTMMDSDENARFGAMSEGWFSEQLPAPGCCAAGGAESGLVADVKVGLSGGRESIVERVTVGMLSVVSWRYLSIDDGLRYLQHFLASPVESRGTSKWLHH